MSGRLGTDSRFLETLFSAGTACGLTDAQLLERFVSGHDETKEAAFEGLVLRHGSMVFDICKKILDNTHDAQDAFQATFLILATRARSIMRRGSVGNWLHGVALRVARRARSDAARRNVQERLIAKLKRWDIEPNTMDNGHDFEVLHDEVERLPRKYREAVVLCYLEGMNLEAAAGQLGCPIGTLGVRLMRAKERLKIQLTRRGMSASVGMLTAGNLTKSTSAALPATLVGSTVNAVMRKSTSGIVSLAAAKLTGDVLRSMFMFKLAKTFAGIMVTFVALGSVGGLAVQSGMLAASQPQKKNSTQSAATWLGQKVVTKYGARVTVGNQNVDSNGFFRVYVVREVDGERARLVADDVNGWIELAHIMLFDEAIDFYSKELLTNPSNALAHSHLGIIWVFLNNQDKALADFTEAIRLEPTVSHHYWNRGNVLRDMSEYEKAIADYNDALRIDPRNAFAFNGRGLLWSKKNEPDKAIADFTAAIRIDPQFAWAYKNRGFAWSKKVEYDKAIADYTEAIRSDPKYVIAYTDRGDAWTKKNEYDKAIADYTEAIRSDPKNVWAYTSRGDTWTKKNEDDKAIADYTEAIQIDPKSVWAYTNRGDAWIKKNEDDKAIADYTEAIRIDPKFVWAHTSRGLVLLRKNEFDKAIADFSDVIRINPQDASAYSNRGLASLGNQQFDKAIADYTELIRLDPNNAQAYSDRGFAWSCKQEYDKAIADYNEAIRLEPLNAFTFSNRAHAWTQKQQHDNAIADYTESIRLDPKDSDAYAGRGLAWSCKRMYHQAIADCTEAIRLDPEKAVAYSKRAWIWATCPDEQHRDGKKAVESATRACELTKWNEPAYLESLAAACAEEGNFDSAVKWQTRAIELYSDGDSKGHRRGTPPALSREKALSRR